MFDIKQQIALASAAAAIIMLMIGLIGGMTFGAALVWGLLVGGVFLQLRRQNLFVAEGTDILHGAMHEVRSKVGSKAGVVHVPREAPQEAAVSAPAPDAAGDAEPAGSHAAENRPAALDAPRDGKPDDLTRIDGIGPKIAEALNDLGIYHLDQIAHWSAEEVAWLDNNLDGVKGRVSRGDWVSQARTLMG